MSKPNFKIGKWYKNTGGISKNLHDDWRVDVILENEETLNNKYVCDLVWDELIDEGSISLFKIISMGETKQDTVNNPKHYQLMQGVEVINVRDAILNKLPANVPYKQIDSWSRSWEYLTRMWEKGKLEDAKKAKWYLERLINQMEEHEE